MPPRNTKLLNINVCHSKLNLQLIVFILLMAILNLTVHAAEKTKELVILNWSEYMNINMIQAFEKEYNVKIKEVYYESDDARDEIMLQTEGKGFDIIIANGAIVKSYIKRHWLKPLQKDKIPNLKHIDNIWKSAFESIDDYAVPYFWGTLGIAYRKDLVSKPITSWMQLYRPSKELEGKILMVKSSRDVIGMGLKALGYSANSENRNELRQAEKLILEQKPHVARFGYIRLDEESSMLKGNIIAATVYGGDSLNVTELNENVVYVIPKEGGNIWVDYFVISNESKQADLAAAFLDFINRPKWAAINAEDMYLATPNKAANKYLSKEFLSDPVIYPDKTLLSRSEVYKTLSPRSTRQRASIFTRAMK